jgi:hypothetical protein
MALADEIANLEAILAAGVKSVRTDLTQTDFDLAEVRRRLAELKRQQNRARRPRSSSIDLSGF